jgi:hypothetical protein
MVLLPLTFFRAMRTLHLTMIVLRQHYRLSGPGECDAKTGTACAVPLTAWGGTTTNLQISGTTCAAPEIATGEARASGASCVRNPIGHRQA